MPADVFSNRSRNRAYDSNESHRSPPRERDRSPGPPRYNESRDSGLARGNPYRERDPPPRPGGDSRGSIGSFPERDLFRDGPARQGNPRDFPPSSVPPRAPKAFQTDVPTGPRAIVYSPEPRGRGGPGRGRGRGWYDEPRDRRPYEDDYRDRRDDRGPPIFRGDRGRDRGWDDRDQRDRDNAPFRGRRPSSPGVGYGRGRPRGRGDWDPRGIGRGYDDRNDLFRRRSRSPPSRRGSMVAQPTRSVMASPPPQAPEVPAFGSVVSHQPPPSGPSEKPVASSIVVQHHQGSAAPDPASPAAPVVIPTGPKSLQKPHPHPHMIQRPPPMMNRPVAPPRAPAMSAVTRPPTEPAPEPKTAAEPAKPAPSKSATRSVIVRRITADTTQPTLGFTTSEKIPVMLRRSLPKEFDVEDEESESESDDNMDDYFETETRKVQGQLEQVSLGGAVDVLMYGFQDELSMFPTLQQPRNIGDDGDEVAEETKASASKPSMLPADELENGSLTDEEYDEFQLAAVTARMKTPPLEILKFEPITPWYEDPQFQKEMEYHESFGAEVEKYILGKMVERDVRNEELRKEYAAHYERYLKFCESDEPEAVRYRAKIAANHKVASRAASLTPATEARPEGRRTTSRFATEHDIARVLQESKREAQERQEASERAAKAKAASDKEAVLPDMLTIEEYRAQSLIDTSHFVPFERAPALLGILPPIDDFTEEECELFEKAFLDYPKQWGKIAEALPGRSYKHCIQHYYLTKHNLNLKEKLRKKEKGRRRNKGSGAGKPKSNALMANLERADETDGGQDATDGGNGERRRPRRAAAPTWPIEQPSESEANTPAPTPGRKAGSAKNNENPDGVPTKRKGKGATREKGPKQPKNGQLLAAAPSAAAKVREDDKTPQPTPTVEKAPLPTRVIQEQTRFVPQWDGSVQHPTVLPAQRVTMESMVPVKAHASPEKLYQHYDHDVLMDQHQHGTMIYDAQQDRRNQQQTSSYWSVTEQNNFPLLLQHYGTHWQNIAKHMESKTHIMVKNYYQRQIDQGNSHLEQIAVQADAAIARGEITAPPPLQQNPVKRRYDAPTPLPRSMDSIEDQSMAILIPHSSPHQHPQQRLPALAQANAPLQAAPTSHISASVPKPAHNTNPGQQWVQQNVQSRPTQRGPQLGVFINDSRPILQAAGHPQPPVSLMPDATASQRSRIVAHEAQLEKQQALRMQQEQAARERRLPLKQEVEGQSLNQFKQYSAPTQQPSIAAQSRVEDVSRYQSDMRRSGYPEQYSPRTAQRMSQPSMDPLGPRPSGIRANPAAQISPLPQAGLSTRQEPPPPPARPQPPALVAARQPETVTKKSNIMSLLNDEPSDPRPPPKRISDTPTMMHVSPAPPQQPALYQPGRSLSGDHQAQIRRKPSIGEMPPASQSYSSQGGSGQGIRVVESRYSAAAQNQPQQRPQISGMPPTSASEREGYAHQQYAMHPGQQAIQHMTQNQYQQQQPTHRHMAYNQDPRRPASPARQYAPSHHPARRTSMDYGHHALPQTSMPPSMHYSPTIGGPQPPTTMASSSSYHQAAARYSIPTSQPPQQPQRPMHYAHSPVGQHSYPPPMAHQQGQHHPQSQNLGVAGPPQRAYSPGQAQGPYDRPGMGQQQQLGGMERGPMDARREMDRREAEMERERGKRLSGGGGMIGPQGQGPPGQPGQGLRYPDDVYGRKREEEYRRYEESRR